MPGSWIGFYGDPAGHDALSRGIQHAVQDRVGTAAIEVAVGAGAAAVMAIAILLVGDFNLSTSWLHNDGFFWEPSNRLRQPAFDVVNSQLSYDPDEHVTLRLWVKNLFDEKYYSNVVTGTSGDQGAPAAPRTFGVSATYRY